MALIKCPECNHDLSDQAKTCPHCGYPIAEVIAQKLPIRLDGEYYWSDYSNGPRYVNSKRYLFKSNGQCILHERIDGSSEQGWMFDYKIVSSNILHVTNPCEGNKIETIFRISNNKNTITSVPQSTFLSSRTYDFYPDDK